jgi:hypothetical protein
MPGWGWFLLLGSLVWILVAVLITLALGRFVRLTNAPPSRGIEEAPAQTASRLTDATRTMEALLD